MIIFIYYVYNALDILFKIIKTEKKDLGPGGIRTHGHLCETCCMPYPFGHRDKEILGQKNYVVN